MKKRFSEEQIIGFLKEADGGVPVKELARKHGFSDASFYLWRSKFGGMDGAMNAEDELVGSEDVDLRRRFFLKSVSMAALVGGATGCTTLKCSPHTGADARLGYELIRPADRLFVQVEAIGFCEQQQGRRRFLKVGDSGGTLVFTFPPQHFAESAIPIEQAIPTQIALDEIRKIDLVAGRSSRLVFKVLADHKPIELSVEALLDWSSLEPEMPDLEALKPQRYVLGFNWFGEPSLQYESVVEMPWGVYLQPTGKYRVDFQWTHETKPITRFGQTELWFSSVEHPKGPQYLVPFEVLDVRGLAPAQVPPPSGIGYQDDADYAKVQGVVECSPTTNFDRLELAASLSRRFEYTGDPQHHVDTEELWYSGVSTGSCYEPGRTLAVQTFGISSLGGWLDIESEWVPHPGCALKAWTHHASLGRDNYVKYERAGFLYPFGIPAELVILSEREFIRDNENHYVAPLIKQAFIQIPQPNAVEAEPLESPFPELSVTTVRTPPLDIPVFKDASGAETPGNLVDYARCDYFLPKVGKKPFEFEHRGYDHEGNAVVSRMPMVFVSNKATNSQGLIPETNALGTPRPKPAPAMRPVPVSGSTCSITSVAGALPEDCFNFDLATGGLRALDTFWQQRPFRFPAYAKAAIALAPAQEPGDTTNDVEWIEWVRARLPDTDQDGIAAQPFLPRARTLKIALPSMRQFSGQPTFMLGTYRDLRSDGECRMDPEPTLPPKDYLANVLRAAPDNTLGAYLHILPLKQVRDDAPALYPFDPAADSDEKKIRNVYFGKSMAATEHPVPATLFGHLRNEMQFGFDASSESLGGVATPDSSIGLLTRVRGPLGDAVADPKRWKEASAADRFQVLASRIDFVHYRLTHRADALSQPFDLPNAISNQFPLCEPYVQLYPNITRTQALRMLGGSPPPTLGQSGLADLASLFGVQAEILPGIRLSRVLKALGIGALEEGSPEEQTGPTWSYTITGLDEILALFGDGPGQITPAAFAQLVSKSDAVPEPGEELEFGVEARLDWETQEIAPLDLGFMHFLPSDGASFTVHAAASMALGDRKPRISAVARLAPFRIIALRCLDVEFKQVRFEIREDGSREFTTDIGEVQFTGALSFINNLKSLFKSLEDRFGIILSVTPQLVSISQKIMIPPTDGAQPAGTLQVGPATISNLNFNWGVRIPLVGRSAMSVAFGLASREDPLTIFVPPYYGGKAHALMEVTTRGVRLFEVSMEFGALILAKYSIAEGEVSFMAGIFFQITKDPSAGIDRFMLTAYVKVTGLLDVAKIIRFSGLIFVGMTYEKGGKAEGSKLAGQATVTVSMKIGFVRVSYSFTARHEENREDGANDNGAVTIASNFVGSLGCEPVTDPEADDYPFRRVEVRQAWKAYVEAFAREGA